MRQGLHLDNDDTSLGLEQVRVALIQVQLGEVLAIRRHQTLRCGRVLASSGSSAKRHAEVVARQVRLVSMHEVNQEVLGPLRRARALYVTISQLHAFKSLLFGHLHRNFHLLLEPSVAERIVPQDATHGLVAASELTANHDGLGHLLCQLAADHVL